MTERAPRRCRWARGELDVRYHDEEWGVPLHDDRKLFELLILEGAQAGLSWSTVLARREGYRAAFDGFDPAKVARYDAARRRKLLGDVRIIRHRGKIDAAVADAGAFLEVQREHRGFAFVGPTICYAFMQAAGLVNDHARECFRHAALAPPVGRRQRIRRDAGVS